MICIKFGGGLGNQMFQYGMYLLMRKLYPKAKIKIDLDSYKYAHFHTGFDLKRVFAVEIPNYNLKNKYSKVEYYYYNIRVNLKKIFCSLNIMGVKSFNGDNPHVNPELFHLNAKRYNYLYATWESEYYISQVKDEVFKAFKFKPFRMDKNIMIQKDMLDNYSVSLHIRRGDYLNSPFVALAETDYYVKALEYIKDLGKEKLKLFIFSDDIEWCRNNLNIADVSSVYINWNNGLDSFEDMHLMSLCKCNVIANSTFSWWGAFLNQSKSPLVICPKQYYKDIEYNNVFIDYHYPKSWILI